MKKDRVIPVLVVLFLAVGLAACERSVATPLPETEGEDFPVPGATEEPLDALGEIATQTAMAQSGEGGEENEGSTPETEATQAPTSTPQPEPKNPTAKPGGAKDSYSVPNQYTLKSGEFPYCIARRFNIHPDTLLNTNGIARGAIVYPGTVLTIPKDAAPYNVGPRQLRAHPTDYTVQAGDTVYSIACLFGDVDPRAIEDENGLKGAYTLNVGQVLHIP